jgi:hypothetical protein
MLQVNVVVLLIFIMGGCMKIRFLAKALCMLLMVQVNLLAFNMPKHYKKIKCSFKAIVPYPRRHQSHPHVPLSNKVNIPGHSSNWCGYVTETQLNPSPNTVSAVYGSWVAPSIQHTKSDTYCAVWVGIDGFSSNSVEQIGTGHDFIQGQEQHYAWFEMYPNGSYSIESFPVQAGDVLSASVEYKGKGVFVMSLYNHTEQVMVTIPTSYTSSTAAKRISAEWIVEAPYLEGILPLNDFGKVLLTNCSACINGVTKTLSNSSWTNSSLEMTTNNGTPKAIESNLGNSGSFCVVWKHQ